MAANGTNGSASTLSETPATPRVLEELHSPIFAALHEAKAKKGMSFEDVAKAIGRSEVYTAAIFYGQAKPLPEDLDALSKALEIPSGALTASLGPSFWPHRAGLIQELPPRDPVIYRLYEAVLVYGHPIKHLIHEKFGDGIMSAIDFNGEVERVPDPKGDRVRLTLEGKYLAYKRW
ncbi:cyanate hydratase [Jaminaea rosea]|uniref:Cyanate hydratase n=1 Tax=Jaminaea rosea TaxID=1569628 RepID=A0A316UQV2_9BASI|nr:cyanate hydratase [Jaminaea rosea]PWN27666.1 cyanate hydratase [Jaminaea rosea]